MNTEYNRRKEIMEQEALFEKIKQIRQEEESNSQVLSMIQTEEEKFYEEVINDDYLGTSD